MTCPPIIKRSQLNRELSCQEYDQNLDALRQRCNHLGTQAASTIYDLETVISQYTFISNLETCCTQLRQELDDLLEDLFGEGELSEIVNNLRTELVTQILELESEVEDFLTRLITSEALIEDLEEDVVGLSAAITVLTNQVNSFAQSIANRAPIDSPLFTGTPRAPTANILSNSNTVATTSFVHSWVPVGVILPYAGNTLPAGFLFCAGQVMNSADFPALASIITGVYGQAPAGQFVIPDLRGRFPIGSGVNTVQGGAYALGVQGGATSVSLLAGHMPPHSHVVSRAQLEHTHDFSIPAHQHITRGENLWQLMQEANGDYTPGPYAQAEFRFVFARSPMSQSFVSNAADVTGTTAAVNTTVGAFWSHPFLNDPNVAAVVTSTIGSSAPFSILPPLLGINFIIKMY